MANQVNVNPWRLDTVGEITKDNAVLKKIRVDGATAGTTVTLRHIDGGVASEGNVIFSGIAGAVPLEEDFGGHRFCCDRGGIYMSSIGTAGAVVTLYM